jgi:hypothetical protein
MATHENFHDDFLARFIDAQRAFHAGDPKPNIALCGWSPVRTPLPRTGRAARLSHGVVGLSAMTLVSRAHSTMSSRVFVSAGRELLAQRASKPSAGLSPAAPTKGHGPRCLRQAMTGHTAICLRFRSLVRVTLQRCSAMDSLESSTWPRRPASAGSASARSLSKVKNPAG